MADNISEELARNAEILNRSNEELDKLIGHFSSLRSSSKDASSAASDLAESFNKTAKADKEAAAARKKMYEGAAAGIKQMNEASKSYTEGVGKYAPVFEEFGNSVRAASMAFGPLGKVVGFAVEMFMKLIADGAKFNDTLYKSYTTLADFGATAGISSKDLLKLGTNAGFTSGNLEVFSKNATNLGTSLVGLGGSASGGIKAFSELATVTDETMNKFTRMGYSQEQVLEMQSKYVEQTVKVGGALGRTPKELAAASKDYISNMQIMAELTGISAKKQQEAMDLALANENFNAYISDLERERATTTDKARKEELTNIINSSKQFAAYSLATDDAKTATAKLELISNKTGEIYTKNSAHLINMGYDVEKVNKTLKSGKLNAGLEAVATDMQETARGVENFRQTYGEMGYAAGEASRNLQGMSGASNEARKKAAENAKFLSMSAEEQQAYIKGLQNNQKKLEEGGKEDKAVQAEAQRRTAELAAKIAEDTKNALASQLTTGILNAFMNIIQEVQKTLTAFYKWLEPWVVNISKTLDGWLDAMNNAIKKVFAWIRSWIPGGGEEPTTGAAGGAGGAGGGAAAPTAGPQAAAGAVLKQAGAGGNVPTGGAAPVQVTQEDLAKKYNLKLRESGGDIQHADSGISPKLLTLAQQVQSNIPNFGAFTGFNDKFHQEKSPSSKHTSGLAMDFVLSKTPDVSEGQKIISMLRGMGASTVIDEYNFPSAKATAGHIHAEVPQAKLGGIFSGPKTGYPVTMHGTEMITPLDANSILAKLATTSSTETTSKVTENQGSVEMMSVLVDKVSQMIERLDQSNDIQSKILTYARV